MASLKTPPASMLPLKTLSSWQELLLKHDHMKILSQFGLQTPESVDEFFRSAAGKDVTNQLEEKVAFEHAIEHEQEIERNDRKLLETRLLAGLLLFALDKKAEASKKFEEIAKELDKELHDHKAPTPKPTAAPADEKKRLELEATFYKTLSKTTLANQIMLQKEERELLQQVSDLSKRLINLQANHPNTIKYQEQLTMAQQKLTGNQATQALMSTKIMQITQAQQIIQNRISRLNNPNIAAQPQAVVQNQANSAAPRTRSPQSPNSAVLNAAPNTLTPTMQIPNIQHLTKAPKQKVQPTPTPTLSPFKKTPGNT